VLEKPGKSGPFLAKLVASTAGDSHRLSWRNSSRGHRPNPSVVSGEAHRAGYSNALEASESITKNAVSRAFRPVQPTDVLETGTVKLFQRGQGDWESKERANSGTHDPTGR
jgi:hypothetical protein